MELSRHDIRMEEPYMEMTRIPGPTSISAVGMTCH